jgi:tetratricopeptide (TPR) repeat protein
VAPPIKNLPILLGILRQEAADGELKLEQNDGARRFYFSKGQLIHLSSDAAGEQFGNYLLRQGILDLPALNELLANDERYRIGEKVIQWGMMSLDERDAYLRALQNQIMIHALEHPVVTWEWTPLEIDRMLEQDLHFKLLNRHFLWDAFQECHRISDLLPILEAEPSWRWSSRPDLLDSVSDLPLNPGTAYALSFLGTDPLSFETFHSLSGLDEEASGRLLATLWALGALTATGSRIPTVAVKAQEIQVDFIPRSTDPTPQVITKGPDLPGDFRTPRQPLPALPSPPAKAPLPFIMPAGDLSSRKALPPLELTPKINLELDPAPPQPEFLDLEPEADPVAPDPLHLYSASAYPPAPPPPPPRPDPFLHPPPPAKAEAPAPPSPYRGDPFSRPTSPPPSPVPPPAPAPPPPPPAPAPASTFQPAPIPSLQEPILEGPAKARALLRKARQQSGMDRTVEAVRTLEQVVQLDPDLDVAYDAWLLLGKLRLANPAWSTRAIDALQHASQVRPRSAEPWATMGELYHRKGFEANAAACFRKALELDPSVPIPPDVDLGAVEQPQIPAPQKKGLLGRLGSILGRSGRS